MGSEAMSFTSPYTVKTLDQIPTPVLKLLVSLGPALRYIAQLAQVIMWKSSQPRLSILMVLIWIITCLWTWQLLALGFPGLILYKLAQDWLAVRMNRVRRENLEKVRQEQRRKREEKLRQEDDDDERNRYLEQQKEEEANELISRKIRPAGQVSLDDTLEDLVIINAFLDHAQRYVERAINIIGESNPVSVLSVLMYVAPLWILINWWFGAQVIMAIVGAVLLVSPSPWFQIIVSSMRRNIVLKHLLAAMWAYGVAVIVSVFRFDLQFKERIRTMLRRAKKAKANALSMIEKPVEIQQDDSKGTRTEMIFQFEVYENQRWWLGVHWTTNMMPNERGPWTDSQLKPIPSKEEFQLPESTSNTTYQTINEKQTIKRTTRKVWTWADGDWWVDMTGELEGKVDHNGWEYGNNAWKQLSGMPGIQTFTRRRRWCRRARLVEREIEEIRNNDEAKKEK
ncbi:hypothetical protein RMATCC62417_09051 [Rhizopus microsporus]|nr:hypothetical protein RMATCC62417_09051 [Rhizopus microsporus]CEJ04401.1 hypothetical protein RMCBS344292_18363 [Rhizopus microsporus]